MIFIHRKLPREDMQRSFTKRWDLWSTIRFLGLLRAFKAIEFRALLILSLFIMSIILAVIVYRIRYLCNWHACLLWSLFFKGLTTRNIWKHGQRFDEEASKTG